MIHVKSEQLQITVLKQSHDLSKTVNILKANFDCYHPYVFTKLFRMVKSFRGLWYMVAFCRKWNWINCRSRFRSDDVTLEKLLISWKNVLPAIVQMYFQSFNEWLLCFRAYDARYLHFNWMSNWSNCRSLFWNNHLTLVKLLIFSKDIFSVIFLKLFSMFHSFHGLWYTLPAYFAEYLTESITDIVVNRSA